MCIPKCKCDEQPEVKDGFARCLNSECEEFELDYLVGEWTVEMMEVSID